MFTLPHAIETTETGEKIYDLSSRLLRDRIVILGSAVTDDVATALIAQFLFLEMDNPNKDIHLYIHSPGGSVSAGMAIYDMMQFIKCDIATYCLGTAASMGSLLLTAGTHGKRHMMPNGRVLIHQPHMGDGGIGGQVTDIEIHARELVRTKTKLIDLYSHHSSQNTNHLMKMMERDHYMNAEEAKKFGLVDHIIECRKNRATATLLKKA